MDQTKLLMEYYADNAMKLRKIVDRMLKGFGGIYEKDLHDFYSIANEVFVDVIGKYNADGNQSFDAFLVECISNKVKSEITARNREKRTIDRIAVSLDTPINNDESTEEITLADTIEDKKVDVEEQVLSMEEMDEESSDGRLDRYIEQLSDLDRKIVRCIMRGLNAVETIASLHITQKEFDKEMRKMKSYEYTQVLF